jgi:Formamidopyrimidine-DNA glycosylase
MPELPDLEVFKDNIFRKLSSKRLVGLEVFNRNKVITPETYLKSELVGRDLAGIGRVGKELMFDFGGAVIAAHLMLNGVISILPDSEAAAVKFKIFALKFEKETVVFSDRGGLCTIKYNPVPDKTPDAFDDAFSFDYFTRIAGKKSRTNVKAFLIDQSVVKGIGNAYADEILWAARISPLSVVGKIPEDTMRNLYDAVNSVLKEAVDSIKRISPDIISGEERGFLKVHRKDIGKTVTGHPIAVATIASKITYYTEEQIIYQ